jgi:hypothetical protein
MTHGRIGSQTTDLVPGLYSSEFIARRRTNPSFITQSSSSETASSLVFAGFVTQFVSAHFGVFKSKYGYTNVMANAD